MHIQNLICFIVDQVTYVINEYPFRVGTVMRMANALENVMTTQIALRSLAVNAKTTSAWIPLAAPMMNAQYVYIFSILFLIKIF